MLSDLALLVFLIVIVCYIVNSLEGTVEEIRRQLREKDKHKW